MQDANDRLANLMAIAAKKDAKIEEQYEIIINLRDSIEKIDRELKQKNVEQEVWKASETRAIRECEEYLRQRNSATERINDLQRNFDEREHNHEKITKKLETRLEEVSRDLQKSRKQLSDMMDDQRTFTARREAELKDAQIKSEKYIKDVENLKAELAASRHSEEMLQSRIKELSKQVSDNEEKLLSYKGRDLSYTRLGTSQDESSMADLALSQAK